MAGRGLRTTSTVAMATTLTTSVRAVMPAINTSPYVWPTASLMLRTKDAVLRCKWTQYGAARKRRSRVTAVAASSSAKNFASHHRKAIE